VCVCGEGEAGGRDMWCECGVGVCGVWCRGEGGRGPEVCMCCGASVRWGVWCGVGRKRACLCHTFIGMHAQTRMRLLHAREHMHACKHVIHVHSHVYIYIHVYVCIYICIYTYMCMCIYVYICVYIYTHMNIYINMHVCLNVVRSHVPTNALSPHKRPYIHLQSVYLDTLSKSTC